MLYNAIHVPIHIDTLQTIVYVILLYALPCVLFQKKAAHRTGGHYTLSVYGTYAI